MTNKKHFGELKANQRVKYLKDLSVAVELHDCLEKLKEKYGVSFGKVNLDSAIISYLFVDNVIFLAGINQRIIPGIFPSYTRLPDGKNEDDFEKEDLEKLTSLQKEFEKSILENKPLQVNFSEDKIVEALKKVRPNPNGEETNLSYFNSCNLATKSEVYDYIMHKQGFANHKENSFWVTLKNVPANDKKLKDDPEFLDSFVVQYERLSTNKQPHLSMFYDGCQGQERMDKKHPAYEFYKKWNVFGMPGLTIEEWNELMSDIEKLKKLHEEYLNNHQ